MVGEMCPMSVKNKAEILADSALFAEMGLVDYLVSKNSQSLAPVLNLAHNLYKISNQINNGSFDSEAASAIDEAIGDRYAIHEELSLAHKIFYLAHELESIERKDVIKVEGVCSLSELENIRRSINTDANQTARDLATICSDTAYYLANKSAVSEIQTQN